MHVCNCYRKSNREQRDVDSDREREQHVSDSDVGMKGNLGRWHVQRCLGLGLGLSSNYYGNNNDHSPPNFYFHSEFLHWR